jgi:hypothetical protein
MPARTADGAELAGWLSAYRRTLKATIAETNSLQQNEQVPDPSCDRIGDRERLRAALRPIDIGRDRHRHCTAGHMTGRNVQDRLHMRTVDIEARQQTT